MKKNGNIGKTEKDELEEMLFNRLGDLTGDKKTPSLLTDRQMTDLEHEIEDEWGTGKDDGNIFHELTSEYVHTDVLALGKKGEPKTFATFGMSAREMAVPEEVPPVFGRRIELVMRSTSALDLDPEQDGPCPAFTAANALVGVSKYPFRADTWLGLGHTLDAGDAFRKEFGYEFFLFLPVKESEIKGLGTVQFLQLIPVYEKERDWMAARGDGSIRFLRAYLDAFEGRDEDIFCIDAPRKVIIPADDDEEEDEEDLVIE